MHPLPPIHASRDSHLDRAASGDPCGRIAHRGRQRRGVRLAALPRPHDLTDASQWIAAALADRDAHRREPFAVLDAVNGAVIGSTSYWDYDRERLSVEIGSTWLRKTYWHSGCNAEAKLLLLTHAFEHLGCERVAFRTDILNERSRLAIERLGAIREGVHRHELQRRDGSWRDSVHYSILLSEWPAPSGACSRV